MSKSPKELEIFSVLNKEKISKIIGFLDESIIKEQLSDPQLQNLEKLGFTNKQARDILDCFFNFYAGIEHYDSILSLIDSSNLTSDAKNLAKNAYEEIRQHADKTKISMFKEIEQLEQFGHPHLHYLEVHTEFRPIIKNGKIERFAASVVFDGSAQNTDHDIKTPINFQMSMNRFKEFVKDLSNELEDAESKIASLKKQLGDNIVI